MMLISLRKLIGNLVNLDDSIFLFLLILRGNIAEAGKMRTLVRSSMTVRQKCNERKLEEHWTSDGRILTNIGRIPGGWKLEECWVDVGRILCGSWKNIGWKLEEYWVEVGRILDGNWNTIRRKLNDYWVEVGRMYGRREE
jgi:hypothetical protein